MDLSFDDEPMPEFRGRCRTWPTHVCSGDVKPEQSSGIGSSSNFSSQTSTLSSSRYPSLNYLESPSSWSTMNSSAEFAERYFLGGDHSAHSNTSLVQPEKRRRERRRNTENAAKKINPWGEESYADLIARALESTPESRLRLNEIYQWFIDNVSYFQDRAGPEEAAGWKNSIRHNLSLHSRFMRVQNEGAGKSSWWVINPDAKPGRNPRRRAATMEASTKAAIDKKRRGARKRVEMGMRGSMQSINESMTGSQLSVNSHDLFNDCDDGLGPQYETFRARTQSNVSMPGGISPQQPFDDFDFPPWANSHGGSVDLHPPSNNQAVNELLDRTDQMRLDSDTEVRRINNGLSFSAQHSPQFPMPQIKEEPKVSENSMTNMFNDCIPSQSHAPSMYQDVTSNQMRSNIMQHQQPSHSMLSQRPKLMPTSSTNVTNQYYGNNGYNVQSVMNHGMQSSPMQNQGQAQWISQHSQFNQRMVTRNQGVTMAPPPYQHHPDMSMSNGSMNNGLMCMPPSSSMSHSHSLPSHVLGHNQPDLPMDLENLATLDSRIMDCDVEAVLRHELSHSDSPQLHFDI